MRTATLGLGIVLTLALAPCAHAAMIDWAKVDSAFGKTASVQGEIHRYGFPRSDLQVTLDGVTIKPALALGGWARLRADERRQHGRDGGLGPH
jgi:hypothetical protein